MSASDVAVAAIPALLLVFIIAAMVLSFADRSPARRRRWRIVTVCVGCAVVGSCVLIAANLGLGA